MTYAVGCGRSDSSGENICGEWPGDVALEEISMVG